MTGQSPWLELSRVFDAPRERVFDIWTTPAELVRCFGLKKAQVELRVGGKYVWYFDDDPMDGVIEAVSRPAKLVYRLRSNDAEGRPIGDTLVTLTFNDAGGGRTVLVLRHEGFEIPEQCEEYTGGWKDCLDSLERNVAGAGGV